MWDFLRSFRVPALRDAAPGYQGVCLSRFAVTILPHSLLTFAPFHIHPLPSCTRMKTGGQFALLDFPVEIICHILAFVSYRDLIHSTLVCDSDPQVCSPTNASVYTRVQTCKFIRNTVQKSAFLSYLIDLAYHQLQATETFTVPYAARKQRLLKSQNRWSKLEWATKHEVECPHTAYMYDFVNGIYAIGQNAANDRRFSENVTFYRLPPHSNLPAPNDCGTGSTEASGTNGASGPGGNPGWNSWAYAFGMTILDFTMDPEQDLLVLLALAPPELVPLLPLLLLVTFPGAVLNMCHSKVSIFLPHIPPDFVRQRNASTSGIAFFAIPSENAGGGGHRPCSCL